VEVLSGGAGQPPAAPNELAHFPCRALFSLMPDGRQSITHESAVYFPLSYHKHILPWLEAAIVGLEAPRLRETLHHYVEVLRTL